MSNGIDLFKVPDGLPAPSDDGAAAHLVGLPLPDVSLASTSGKSVSLAARPGVTVVFCYPMTGRPSEALPEGWDQIPGARGCTPQACGYRDSHGEFEKLGVSVFGISTQSPDDQREAATRLGLPYPLLSDERQDFQRSVNLPVFTAGGKVRLRRLTMAAVDGIIQRAWYPIFPSDSDVPMVLDWIRGRS